MPNAGPPPVRDTRVSVVEQNYATVVDTLKADRGAETKAIRAMFGGDKQLMDSFLAVAFSMLASNNDLLQRATPMSIIQSIKDAASLGLRIDGIEGAIVRYSDTAKFMPMYIGYKKRMLNSGRVIAVDAKTVFSQDEFDFETGPMGTTFRHHPHKATRDDEGARTSSRGSYQGFYAYARTPDGFVYFRYMDVDEVNRIRDTHGQVQTRDGKPLPWATDYEAMALKTVIRQLQKDVPQDAIGKPDPLVQIERDNDEAMAALKGAADRLDDGLSQVRAMAMRAVGAGSPPDEETGDSDAPAGAGEALAVDDPVAMDAVDVPADPGADPNVAAAMALTAEQEQLRRNRERRP